MVKNRNIKHDSNEVSEERAPCERERNVAHVKVAKAVAELLSRVL